MPPIVSHAKLKQRLFNLAVDVPVVITVARLDPQKRSALLPDIIWRTRQLLGWSDTAVDPLPVLIVLGDGPSRPEVEARTSALELGPSAIRLLGSVANPQSYLQAADVFILPSVSEGAVPPGRCALTG